MRPESRLYWITDEREAGKSRRVKQMGFLTGTGSKCHRGASERGVTERGSRCLKIRLPTGSLPASGVSIGEFPQDVERLLDVASQGNGIQGLELPLQGVPLLGGVRAGSEHPL